MLHCGIIEGYEVLGHYSFDNGGPLSELLMLGNIATVYPGETLNYDPAQGRLTNKDEANERLVLRYGEGWSL